VPCVDGLATVEVNAASVVSGHFKAEGVAAACCHATCQFLTIVVAVQSECSVADCVAAGEAAG